MSASRDKIWQSTDVALQKAVAKHQSGDLAAAARAYRAILKRQPRHPDALHLLGLTAHQTGDHVRATRHIKKAVTLRPKEPLFLNNLGLAQYALGNLAAAKSSFRQILAISGENLPTRLHLGTVLAVQGRDEEALAEFVAVITDGQPEALWHAKAGQALRQLGRLEEAEAQFRSASELAPQDVELLASLASLIQVRGRNRDAIELYRRVLEIRPDYPDVLINLGNCLIMVGEIEESREAYLAALRLDEKLEGAIIGLVYLDEREGDFDAAWERLAPCLAARGGGSVSGAVAGAFATMAGRLDKVDEAIETAERSLSSMRRDGGGGAAEMNLRFAVGRLYERTGEFNQAFAHFQAGNALTKEIFDAGKFEAEINSLIEFFNNPEPEIAADNVDETPVFIVGMPRSGTSLVEQILASHQEVHGAGEVPYLFEAIDTMSINNPHELAPSPTSRTGWSGSPGWRGAAISGMFAPFNA